MPHMTVEEMMKAGISREDADAEMHRRVFGHNVQFVRGKPVEQGIGSLGHENEQHFAALEKYSGREAADLARAKAAKRG
jgi:hypothetical protein